MNNPNFRRPAVRVSRKKSGLHHLKRDGYSVRVWTEKYGWDIRVVPAVRIHSELRK